MLAQLQQTMLNDYLNTHVEFFTDYAKTINSEFTEESELVLERFKKVYP